MARVHYLKIFTQLFKEVMSGRKTFETFEVIKSDRNFQVGDTLILEEFDPDVGRYKEGWIPKEITNILDNPLFVKEGYIILSLKDIKF